ncbi:hypothetical protein M408DRAFT_23558 [Serendipita vermifera MAFF 305830]|uniref:Uncharacterized protein n=1 Tax=Serendipita vermifera MAFF 305830 TaxID=933852 RepID=A0A0C3AVC8_SERVB|nr:hypothetical protein M408DRAFT_23558 [Serendipita vermifera MAFF 305830]
MHLTIITIVAVLAHSVQILAAPVPELYQMEDLVARADEPGPDPASAIQQFLQASRRDITHPILPPPRWAHKTDGGSHMLDSPPPRPPGYGNIGHTTNGGSHMLHSPHPRPPGYGNIGHRINAPSSMLSQKPGVPLPARVKKLNMPKKGGRAAIPKGSKGMKAAM